MTSLNLFTTRFDQVCAFLIFDMMILTAFASDSGCGAVAEAKRFVQVSFLGYFETIMETWHSFSGTPSSTRQDKSKYSLGPLRVL